MKQTLRFRPDGKFKVLVFSDVHAADTLSPRTQQAIEAVVQKESPDLVLFNGDLNMQPVSAEEVYENTRAMTAYLEAHHIPWAHVYGNHDTEGRDGLPNLPKEEQQKIFESFSCCLSESGDPSIAGVGNYVLPVLRSDSDKIAFNVWGLDSGSYLEHMRPGLYDAAVGCKENATYNHYPFAYIPFSQISWYYRLSQEMETANGDKIPGMMFFHMPLCEYEDLARNFESLHVHGEKLEDVCCSELNSGLFCAALERGDIRIFVAGHDHVNDYEGEYCGIRLAYDASIGFQIYREERLMGGRVVLIDENDAAHPHTYMSYLHDIPGWRFEED